MRKKLTIEYIPISHLKVSEFNVRKHEDDVSELAKSIEEKGILQPLLVRPESNGKKEYGIVIGSRRFAAAKQANLKEVPASIQEVDSDDATSISLVENLQRNDLKPKETIEGINKLLQNHTQREVAQMISRSKGYVNNMVNLAHLVGKLDKHHVEVQMLPSEKERDAGKAIPFNHAIHLGNALDYSGVKDFFKTIDEQAAEDKTVELAKAITKEKQTDAQKILEVFKKEPEQDIDIIVEDALSTEGEGEKDYRRLSRSSETESTELTKMGDVRDYCRYLWQALTGKEFMPHQDEDLILDHIKPTREYRKFVYGLSEHNKAGLHDWLSYTDAAIQDMLQMIEETQDK